VDANRQEILPSHDTSPNSAFYVVLSWAQAVVRQSEMQLHVTSCNNTTPPFPLMDEVDCMFVSAHTAGDNYQSANSQWAKLRQSAPETLLPRTHAVREQVIID
jgi:hypothetical protein